MRIADIIPPALLLELYRQQSDEYHIFSETPLELPLNDPLLMHVHDPLHPINPSLLDVLPRRFTRALKTLDPESLQLLDIMPASHYSHSILQAFTAEGVQDHVLSWFTQNPSEGRHRLVTLALHDIVPEFPVKNAVQHGRQSRVGFFSTTIQRGAAAIPEVQEEMQSIHACGS